jgi:hypothetical protein
MSREDNQAIFTQSGFISKIIDSHDLSNVMINKFGLKDFELNANLRMLSFISKIKDVENSKLLLVLRQVIVNSNNFGYPKQIVRYISRNNNQVLSDGYDPMNSKALHPFLEPQIIKIEHKIIRDFKILKHNIDEKCGSEIKQFYENLTEKINKVFNIDITNTSKPLSIFLESRIKIYIQKQLAKKLSFGNLEQLLSYDVDYPYELQQINSYLIENDFEFILCLNGYEKIRKSEINVKVVLKRYVKNANGTVTSDDPNDEIKLNELDYKNRFKLTLLLTLREPWIMRSYYRYDAVPFYDLSGNCIKSFFQLYNGDNQTRQVLLIDKPDKKNSDDFQDLIPHIQNLVNETNIQVIIALCSDSVTAHCRETYPNNTFSMNRSRT